MRIGKGFRRPLDELRKIVEKRKIDFVLRLILRPRPGSLWQSPKQVAADEAGKGSCSRVQTAAARPHIVGIVAKGHH